MKQATTTNYRRTREAAKRKAKSERTNREATWDLILAGAADGEEAGLSISGTENVLRVSQVCAEELVTDTGEPLAKSTVKNMLELGRWLHEEATAAEIEIIRTLAWTAARDGALKQGATPSATADAVSRGIRSTGDLMAEFSSTRSGADDEDESTTYSDDDYIAAVSEIARHHTAEGRGEYQRGPMARLAGTLLGQMLIGEVVETDWDSALNDLLSEDA